jgi:heptosyltransferase-2
MRIAIFLPNWVGDVVMATPAVRAARRRYPDARIVAVGKPYISAVLDRSPWLDEFLPLEKGREWVAAARLRDARIDLVMIFPNSFRTALVAWLGRCRRRVGYARYFRNGLLTDRLYPVRDDRGRVKPTPILPAYNRIAEVAGCPVDSMRMELFTTPADETTAENVWRECRFDRYPEVVCLNPGAAFGAAKLWPAESFAALARRLADERGCGVLVLCGPAERDLANRIAALAGREAVRSLANSPVSIGLTKACVRRTALLVSTDSGPRHFAAAFGRPVVALFGPTHIAWTDTFYADEIQLQKRVPCGPCQQRTCPEGHHRCMVELTTDDVFRAATTLLDRVREGRRAG